MLDFEVLFQIILKIILFLVTYIYTFRKLIIVNFNVRLKMNKFKSICCVLLTILFVGAWIPNLSAKHHRHHSHHYKSRSTSFGLNLSLNPTFGYSYTEARAPMVYQERIMAPYSYYREVYYPQERIIIQRPYAERIYVY